MEVELDARRILQPRLALFFVQRRLLLDCISGFCFYAL
jgi:hypothetical protein